METITRSVNRNKLAALAKNDHELVKFFENLAQDVTATLPDATDIVVKLATEANSTANVGLQKATQALALAQKDTRSGFGIQVTADARGVVISVLAEQLIAAILPYIPRQVSPVPQWNDSQNVLARKIFGR